MMIYAAPFRYNVGGNATWFTTTQNLALTSDTRLQNRAFVTVYGHFQGSKTLILRGFIGSGGKMVVHEFTKRTRRKTAFLFSI
jgi:hypothetical protein